uniref:SSD domain-containing protein n=1 Tax=Anguilla anguilla TaxID=7936 RepID=A0A0E9QQ57_ANGAN
MVFLSHSVFAFFLTVDTVVSCVTISFAATTDIELLDYILIILVYSYTCDIFLSCSIESLEETV